MEDIRSLADQLRNQIKTPGDPIVGSQTDEVLTNSTKVAEDADIAKIANLLSSIRAFDNSDHKSMVHVRFDANTLKTLNQFKMATGVDVTKLVAYAVRQLFARHPEFKTIIRQFIQNFDT